MDYNLLIEKAFLDHWSKKGVRVEASIVLMNNKDRKKFINGLYYEYGWGREKGSKTFYRGVLLIGSKQIKKGTVEIY